MTDFKPKKYPGYFITFEGIDGSGKSTQARLLYDYLIATYGDDSSVLVREPGSEPVAEKIRHLIKTASSGLTNLAATFLFEAARAQLVQKVIVPALERGKIVICDRFADSTVVYQSMSGETPRGTILDLNYYATGGLMPDLTFFLKISPDVAIRRAEVRNAAEGAHDRQFDFFDASKFAALAHGYEELAHRYKHRVVTVDGEMTASAIKHEVWCVLNSVKVRKHHVDIKENEQ